MKPRISLLCLALIAGCSGEPEDEIPDLPAARPMPIIPIVQQTAEVQPQPAPPPQPQPGNPFAQAIQEAGAQLPTAGPTAPEATRPPALEPAIQEDPTSDFRRIFAQYAAQVADVERSTQNISYKDTKRRVKYYWNPIHAMAAQLQQQYRVDANLLARIIQLGLREKWPTARPNDADACAKMLRRYSTERALAQRRTDAQAGDLVLNQLISIGLQRQMAVKTARDLAIQAWSRRIIGGRSR
jgi:hypothetical protein